MHTNVLFAKNIHLEWLFDPIGSQSTMHDVEFPILFPKNI